ncbi:hypothetical protein G9A89_015410 [Geosiphon pyriformis]|nr:hypothetical protein G9A89_015410 [Geosiphon pyriformis]
MSPTQSNLRLSPKDDSLGPRNQPRFTFPVSFYGMSVYRSYYLRFICVFFLVTLLAPSLLNGHAGGAYAATASSGTSQDCATAFDTNTDYFPTKISPKDATLFSIQYFKNYKLLTNNYTKETFALYQCGTPPPSAAVLPVGTKLFSVPVKSVAVLDTTSNSYLEMLGLRSSITLLDSSADISSACIQLLKGSNITTLSNNFTQRAESLKKVDLAIGAYTADNKTANSVSTSAVSDPGTLNRVDWLEFYGAFFDLEDRAQKLVSQIKDNYDCLKKLANSKAPSTKLVVVWVAYLAPSQYNNNTPSWTITDSVYKKKLTEDAGATYFNTTPLQYSTSESFLKAISNVDILIDETYIASNLEEVLTNFGLSPTADNSAYKFIKKKKIFREDGLVNPTDGRDWFESAVPMGDALLEDVMNAVNSQLPTSSYQRIWLRNVAIGEIKKITSARNCTDSNGPLVDRAISCPTAVDVENDSNGKNDSDGKNDSNTGQSPKSAGDVTIASTTTLFASIAVALLASVFSAFII